MHFWPLFSLYFRWIFFFLNISNAFPEALFCFIFISGLKHSSFKCKQSILSTKLSMFPKPKSVQISKVLGKFCANFKSENRAFLKSSFEALPMIFSAKKFIGNFNQLQICILCFQNVKYGYRLYPKS